MRKLAQLLLLVGLLAAFAVPTAQASDDVKPRQLQASACNTVKIRGKGHVLYRRDVSCSYAKRWARKLRATNGRSKPRGFKCSSGSKFRGGGYCERGDQHFGWYRGE